MRLTRVTSPSVDRAMFGVALRIAALLSTSAVLLALLLETVGDVSRPRLIVSVALIGFATSWVMTGRVQRRPLPLTSR